MPRDSVLAHAPKNPDLQAIILAKQGWGVSAAALVYRMGKLGLLSEWYTTTFWKQIQLHGYRQNEPNPIPREHSGVWQAVFEWLHQHGRNRQDLAVELGNWPVAELRTLVFQLVLSAELGGNPHPTADEPSPKGHERTLRLVR
jgi:hypothetical protein